MSFEEFKSYTLAKSHRVWSKIVYSAIGFFGLILLTAFLSSTTGTIDDGERGIRLSNGAVTEVLEPGRYWKVPIVEDVKVMSVRDIVTPFKREVWLSDQQVIILQLTVNTKVVEPAVGKIYSSYGTAQNAVEQTIIPRVNEMAEIILSQYSAATSVSERPKLSVELSKAIMGLSSSMITVTASQLDNIDFTNEYEAKLLQNANANAELDLLKTEKQKAVEIAARQKIEAESAAFVVRTSSEASSYAKRQEGEAEAYSIRVKGEAEGAALEAQGKALRDNPRLVDLTYARKYEGGVPTTIMGGGNNAIPFFNVNRN